MRKDKLVEKIKKKVFTGFADAQPRLQVDVVTVPANVKVDKINNGGVLLVHDVPITKVGVQQYSDGRYLKTPEALAGMRTDFSPLVISHPDKFFQDMTEDELEEQLIGYSSDGYFDAENGKRYANFYLFIDELEKTEDGRTIIDRLDQKLSIDVSIGFTVEAVPEKGEFNGEQYDFKDVRIVHDHTALLPREVGRWSYPDGVGIGADSRSFIEQKVKEKTLRGDQLMTEMNDSQLVDALKRADELSAKLEESQKALDEVRKELEEARARVDELEAEKKEAEEAAKAQEEAEIKETTDALVKQLYAGREDSEDAKKFREFLDGMSLEKVRFLKDSLKPAKAVDNSIVLPSATDRQTVKSLIDAAREAELSKIKAAQGA